MARHVAPPPDEVASAIEKAYADRSQEVTYLFPLDRADQLPATRFGPWEINRFSPAELARLVQPARQQRFGRDNVFDVAGVSQFQWLVLRRREVLEPSHKQANPLMFAEFEPFGKIDVHPSRFDTELENGLFVVALYPWEDFSEGQSAPGAETLSWDEIGKRPTVTGNDPPMDLEPRLRQLWEKLEIVAPAGQFQCSAFPERPERIRHFFLRGFREDEGIDQLLWYVLAIEAALGKRTERSKKEKIGQRIAALLGDTNATSDFRTLYDRRNEYVHGDVVNKQLWADDLRKARRLARRVVEGLLHRVAQDPSVSRDTLLSRLDSTSIARR